MERRIWFERSFEPGMDASALPELVERLRGTPLRLRERTEGVDPTVRVRRSDGSWSIQEQVGHLLDLEPLWLGRVEDLAAGEGTLREADLENRATWDAGHNEAALADLLDGFEHARARLVARLEGASASLLRARARHPRLVQPMTLVDLAFFVAEHDDHHLATITALREGF